MAIGAFRMKGERMERRAFVQGAFGLVALVAAGGLFAVPPSESSLPDGTFVTPEVGSPELADGPVMVAGISLARNDDGTVRGMYGDTHLFTVDERGAALIRLADGNLTLDELAQATGSALRPADVASFFVALGQAGYLQNTVLVNFVELPA